MHKAVRVHSYSKVGRSKWHHRIYVASLFEVYPRMSDGKKIFKNTGIHTVPTIMNNKAKIDGKDLANKHNAEYISGVGSLHHKLVEEFI